jgi:metal transporter CNNM
MNEALIRLGIALCPTQSAVFSGLYLAVFSLSRLQLRRIARAVAAGAEAPA